MFDIETKEAYASHPNGLWRALCSTKSYKKSLRIASYVKQAEPEQSVRIKQPSTGKITEVTTDYVEKLFKKPKLQKQTKGPKAKPRKSSRITQELPKPKRHRRTKQEMLEARQQQNIKHMPKPVKPTQRPKRRIAV